MEKRRLLNFLNEHFAELMDHAAGDPSNNGLQVQGAENIKRAVFAVDASEALFKKAAEWGADFIFVHHGLSWKNNLRYVTGRNARLLRWLFKHDINLYACHLPLDAHPELGHNAVMAEKFGLQRVQPFFETEGIKIGCSGELDAPLPIESMKELVDTFLNSDSSVFNPVKRVQRIGVVSGGGVDSLEACAENGLDCLITGEMKHEAWHLAVEEGVCVIAAGHYKTEVPGIQTVMKQVQENFELECAFFDIPTGL